jgi:hypothetical protein
MQGNLAIYGWTLFKVESLGLYFFLKLSNQYFCEFFP